MTRSLEPETPLSDEALLRAFVAGDGGAAEAIMRRHLPRVLGQAMRLLGRRDAAEDVAQEAMLRLWRMAPDWRVGEAQLGTWLYRVTANLCIDRMRRRQAQPLESVPEPADETPGAEDRMQHAARVRALRHGLEALPERQRAAMLLRHLEGLGNPEIARIMGISTEAVESLTARGRRGLALQLDGKRDELGYTDD